MEKIIQKYLLLVLTVIFLLGFFLRFYNLSNVPDGLYQDETAIGYNAYSILQTGKDEHGISFPLYFKSFGDQKLPVYIYLTALSEQIFGVNAFAVRMPSALFGSLSIIILYFLVRVITRDQKLSLLSALLLAITPWHLLFSRAGFEVNVALFFALTGVLLLILGLHKSKWQVLYLLIAVIMFGVSLYSYNVTRLLSPLIALSALVIYKNEFYKVANRIKIAVLILLIITISPFLFSILSDAGASSATGALITSSDVQAKAIEFRSYFIEYPFFAKIFFNKWNLTFWSYFENLASIFNMNFFFVNGSNHGNQGVGTSGAFYLFQLPLLLFGMLSLVKLNSKKYILFIYWGIVSFLILGLSKEVPHATRGYFLIIPITVLCSIGVNYFLDKVKNLKSAFKLSVLILSLIFVLFNITYYFASYYIRFPIAYASNWRQQDEDLVNYINENIDKYDKIIIDENADFIYTSYLFYSKYDPSNFYSEVVRMPNDNEGFSKVISFGKLEYKRIDWENDLKKKVLIITNEENMPAGIPILIAFKYPQRPVVLSLKEEVFEFPETKTAYILIESDKK